MSWRVPEEIRGHISGPGLILKSCNFGMAKWLNTQSTSFIKRKRHGTKLNNEKKRKKRSFTRCSVVKGL